MNQKNAALPPEAVKAAAEKYGAYGSEWEKAYFDERSGGYNVYHKGHNFAKTGGGGNAEKVVGKMLAKYSGKQVEFLPERGKKSPDAKFDSVTWDIKYVDNANEATIRNHIRDARKADNAIFYFTNAKLTELNNSIVREVGRFTKENRIHQLPNIYYMDKRGFLKLLWAKQKGG
jgi:transcriptional regulator of met regulon